jgi:Spy/CpxP family protein refolding chaperone
MRLPHRFVVLGLLLGMVCLGAVTTTAMAVSALQQDAAPPDSPVAARAMRPVPDARKQMTRLSRKLQLTPEQAARIEPLLQGRQQQMVQLRGDASLAPRDLHKRLRALRQDTDGQIQAILTGSQRQRYQQMQQAAMQKHKGSKQGAPGANPGAAPDDDDGSP